MQTQNTLLSANWEKSTCATALGNESFTRQEPMVTTTIFCGVTKAPAPFPLPLCRHTSPTWQYGALTTPEHSAEHPTEISHENAGKLGPCCGKTANPWEQNCNLLGQNSCPWCGQKEILVMCKQEERRGWNHKPINPNQSKSIQINPNHHSHHHCFNLQTKISKDRGTKPRAFHLPNEHTGHKPSPAERHPVLHRTFTRSPQDFESRFQTASWFQTRWC